MIPYAILAVCFLSLYFALEIVSCNRKVSSAVSLIPMVPLIVFTVVYAGEIGSDAGNYKTLFYNAEKFRQEPIFSLLMLNARSFGLDFIEFAKLLALLQLLLLALIVIRLRDPLFFMLFYFGCFFLNFHFNTLRNSLALLFMGAMLVQFKRIGILATITSTLIHYSSLGAVLLQRLSLSGRKRAVISLLALGGVLIAIIWFNRSLIADIPSATFVYIEHFRRDTISSAIYPALLLKALVVWLLAYNGGNSVLFVAYVIAVVLIHISHPIFSRVSDLVLFLAVLDFCINHRLTRMRLLAIGLTCILVLSSLMIPISDCQLARQDRWCLSSAK